MIILDKIFFSLIAPGVLGAAGYGVFALATIHTTLALFLCLPLLYIGGVCIATVINVIHSDEPVDAFLQTFGWIAMAWWQ